MSLQWNDRLVLGEPVIDAHRRRLLGDIAELDTLLGEGRNWRVIRPRLAGLYGRLQHDFCCEDMLLRLAGHPDYSVHTQQHRWLEQQAAGLADAMSVDPSGFVLCTGWQFFVAAVLRHIGEEDPCLRAGLAAYVSNAA